MMHTRALTAGWCAVASQLYLHSAIDVATELQVQGRSERILGLPDPYPLGLSPSDFGAKVSPLGGTWALGGRDGYLAGTPAA